MSEMWVMVHEVQKRHYETIGPNEYGRYLLIRQPDALVIWSDPEQLPLLELQRDIERRIARHVRK